MEPRAVRLSLGSMTTRDVAGARSAKHAVRVLPSSAVFAARRSTLHHFFAACRRRCLRRGTGPRATTSYRLDRRPSAGVASVASEAASRRDEYLRDKRIALTHATRAECQCIGAAVRRLPHG
jgi:hypothetical protein